MRRRSFLKTTLVGASAVGSGSCAHRGSTLTSSSADVLAMVGQLRANLEYLATPGAKEGLAAPLPPARRAQGDAAADEQLFLEGAQTLVLAGAFHSMSEDVRAHPAVQQLMGEKLAMMNATAQRLNQVAIATTPEERRALTQQLKEDPAVLDDAAQRLDAEAVRLGLTLEVRGRLRGLFTQVGARLRQSASLAIEEYSHKVARIEARLAEPGAFEREYAARLGAQAFWDFQARQEAYVGAWAAQSGAPSTGRVPLPAGPRSVPPARVAAPRPSAKDGTGVKAPSRNDGSVAVPVGGILLGIGAIAVAGGLVAALSGGGGFGWVPGAIVVTAGALLLIAGFITLLVGLKRQERAQQAAQRHR